MATYNTFIKGIEVPTLDALNSNFLSKTNTDSYTPTANYNPATKKYVDDCIAAINQLHFEIVQTLPATGDPTIIYMISQQGGLGADDYYDEYIYINNNWEKIGSTRIDLSNYYTKTQTDAKLKEYFPVYRLTVNQNGSLNSYVYLNNDCIAQVNAMIADAYARNAPTFAIWLDHRTDATQKTRKGCLLVSNTTNWMETRIERSQQFFGYTQNSTGFRDKNILKYMISFEPKFTTSVPTVNSVALYMVQNDYITQDNSVAYTPTGNYNPATKKYVDDAINGIDLTPYATINYVDNNIPAKTYIINHDGSWSKSIPTSQFNQLAGMVSYYAKYNAIPNAYYISDAGVYAPIVEITVGDSGDLKRINCKTGPSPNASDWGTYYGVTYKGFCSYMAFSFYVPTTEYEAGNIEHVYNSTNTSSISRIAVDQANSAILGLSGTNNIPLGTRNTASFTPTGDYNPATKKYVDDAVAGIPQPDLTVLPIDVSSENEVKTYTYISSNLPYASQRDSHLVLSFFDSADDALYFVNDMYHHGYSNAQIFIWPDDMIGNRRQMIYPITVSILNVDFASKKTMTPTTYFDLYATFIDLTGWGTNGYFGMESARAMLASIEYDSATDSFVKTNDTYIPYFQGSTSVSKIPTKSYVDGLPAEFLNKYIKFAELDYQGNLDWNNFDVNTWYILPQGYDLGTYDANGIFVAQSGNYNSGDRNPKTTLRMISLFATKNHKSSMQYVKFICLAPNPSTWMLNGLHTGILYATASTGASTTSDSAYYSLPSITFSGLMSESTFDVTERTITARQTFNNYAPRTSVAPTNGNDLTNKTYVDGGVSNLASIYDNTATYNVGDLVTKDNTLYTCITAITTAENWDATHWETTTVNSLMNLMYNFITPDIIWESNDAANNLKAIQADISASPTWQLTDLDLTPYKRIKIYSKAGQKSGITASASTTAAMVLEMSLDSRAAIAEYGGNYVGSIISQKPNDNNRTATLTCAVSADKTKFVVLRQTNLYGTGATSNDDVNADVFMIEGYKY